MKFTFEPPKKDFWDKIGTLTPYVGGLFGLLGAKSQRRQQKRMADYYANLTREMQEKTFGNNKALMEMQQKFDRGMFDYSNAYNTPANQMKRLKEAGLNPALMYGQGTTGNTNTSMPTADTIPTTFSGAEIAQSAAAGAQMSVMNSQVQLNKANAIAKGIDSSVKAGQYGIAKKMSQYQMENLASDTMVKLEKAKTEIITRANAIIDNEIKDETKAKIVEGIVQQTANLVLDGKIKTQQELQAQWKTELNNSGLDTSDNYIYRVLKKVFENEELQKMFKEAFEYGFTGGIIGE